MRAVLAEYLFKLADAETTAWKEKGVAVAVYTVAALCTLQPWDQTQVDLD